MLNIPEAVDAAKLKKIVQWPRTANRASDAGHECERYLVAARIRSEKWVIHDIGLQRIFDEGKIQEDAVFHDIREAALEVMEHQRPFLWKKFQITGHIDGKIKDEGGGLIPLEIKSCSPNSFMALQKMDQHDLLNSRYPWIKRYPAQMGLYMLMDNKDRGIMLFKNKVNGELLQIDFVLDDQFLEYLETVLKKLERVNEYCEKDELPPVTPISDCDRCGFCTTLCFPDRDFGPGFKIMLPDPEIERLLNRRDELQEARKEYEMIDKDLKAMFSGQNSIVSGWRIVSKEQGRDYYPDLPEDIKKKYVKRSTFFKTTFERI